MPFEDELTDALNDTAHTFQPDLTSLVNAGVSDGRRRDRRRRVLGVVGTVTALSVVAVGGVFASGALSSDQSTSRSADHRSAPTVTRTGPPSVDVNPAATGKPYTQKQLQEVLKSLLPKGKVTFPSSGSNAPGGVATYATVVYDDGHGASEIDVSLQWVASGDSSAAGLQCPDPAYNPHDVCTMTKVAGGNRLVVDKGWEYPDMKGGMKDWNAWLTTPKGAQVMISEYNSAQEKGTVTRTSPPLSADQLKAVATSAKWTPAVAALPKPKPAPTKTASTSLTGPNIVAVLNRLLPAGVTRSHEHGEDGFADLLLNDGKGNGLFQINVQDFSADLAKGGSGILPLFDGATVLPDGSKLVTAQESAEKGGSGAVQWTADVLRPDGLRIVIMEFNAPAQGVAATRTDPVLTIAQLKAIVTSSDWKL